VLDAFEQEDLVECGARLGERLRAGLLALQQKYAAIGDVRGLGLMLAIEMVADRKTRAPDADAAQRVMERARERGLLFIKCGVHRNVVRFLAPLVAEEADIRDALGILDDALKAALA
jgi:4-aminobutyrate aminotransferase/(S)-3-amino-2-methylpropionate transaminase